MDWPHAPLHRFGSAGVYFITGATLHKQHFYPSREKLNALQEILFANAERHSCVLQAWALFPNHYHLIVQSDDGAAIHRMLTRFHTEAAIDVNRRDGVKGRKVWFQFRDTQLTFEGSWLARLKYTHENAVHHGLVQRANDYHWCSARWFEESDQQAFVESVRRVRIDRLVISDDFAAAPLPR